MEKNIPNYISLANLFCGFFGILAVLNGNLALAGAMIFLGAFFDLFDGMAARMLKAGSEFGKQLDSLCDVVTFGVLPALIAQTLLLKSNADWLYTYFFYDIPTLSLIAFFIVMASVWRLARFNTSDNSSSSYFRGMPTPTAAIFFGSLPLILQNNIFFFQAQTYNVSTLILNPYFMTGAILLISWLMISDIPLFSLKLKSLSWAANKMIYIFFIASLLLFIFFLWTAVPLIVILYVILSFFKRPQVNEL